jgi:septal ring factor EnvC (AmiA/AmiB activator)
MAVSAAVALGGGGLLGAWFQHRRDLPKARAEARNMDWLRFQGEIARLDRKIELQDKRIADLEAEISACHESKDEQASQLAKQEREIVELRQRLVIQESSHNG